MKKHLIFFTFVVVIITTAGFYSRHLIFSMKNENKTLPVPDKVKSHITGIDSKKDSSVKQLNYKALHYDAIVVDTHNDFIFKVYDKGAVFGNDNSFTQSDLPKFKAGGLDVQVFSIWIPMSKVKHSFDYVTSRIEELRTIEGINFDDFEFAKSYDDIIRITNEKKICGLMGIEGGTAIGKDLSNINTFFEFGVRYIGLTWNNSNAIGTSARDAVERGLAGGLTEFGIEVVKKMNEVGMLIDVSHLSEAAFWDVIKNSSQPVIASHSDCYALNPHYRNLKDEQIKAIADGGGYIGVNFYDKFLSENPSDATLETVINHIDHIRSLAGVDCIGIGSDFDGGITPPSELHDATFYPEITRRLVEKGYTEDEIKKILGLNFLRVFKKVCG